MIKQPTSDQLESVAYLFHSNSYHTSNILTMLDAEMQEHTNLVIAPHSDALTMARHAGAVSLIRDLLALFTKK
jgi:hypothetical protein